MLIAGFVGFSAIFTWFSAHEAEHDHNFSVTGVVSALSVFALGALAVAGNLIVGAAGGAALVTVVASRDIHGLLLRLTWIELRSAILLAAITAIVLPLLPDRSIDPWGGLNPFVIRLFTVIVVAISFGGYVGVRAVGESRGLLIGSIAGATVSPTAGYGRNLRRRPMIWACATGSISSGSSTIRIAS